jgi:hypothetical protein
LSFDVAALVLADGSTLRVISKQVPWTDEFRERLLAYKTAVMASVPKYAMGRAKSPRFVFVDRHEDEGLRVVDAAGDLTSD